MFNLIRKDLIIQKSQIMLFIPFVMFFAIFADHMSPFFIFLIASLYIPLNGYIYDEQVESNILLNSLPYTRKEIVAAKYVGSAVYMILSIAVAGIILYLFNFDFLFRDIVIAAGLFFFFAALTFPLFYILKPGNIGAFIMIGLIVSAALLPPALRFLAGHLTAITDFITSLSTTVLYISGTAISISLFLISWLASQIIYQRKVF
ncbi:ABC-2 transporter permease [Oceanobacillus alkalisoli]|uniref:ABC-2 transporter permease n=1 Tax=Oceanobacillus alkalisoli TaxID=2925113 RepID=UPI001EF06B0F|nr:ABC-2 transporter permease [Oceanobacillus alkalisoli]MCF3944718.1 ABC-2 transporter permease [Oceanobacillus alkalisoli]MCG5105067.1 ABC-2 transporter permease [Oceanobacillus alkalisoli]